MRILSYKLKIKISNLISPHKKILENALKHDMDWVWFEKLSKEVDDSKLSEIAFKISEELK